MPSVSVVIRAFNAEKYIVKSLASVINQDYNGLMEIIICYDEGTTDNTLGKIADYLQNIVLKENRKIKIIRHTHMTPFRAMVQCGFLNAKGEFIKPLDYDNYLPTNWISRAIDELSNNNASFGFSQALIVDDTDKILGTLGEKPKDPYNMSELIKNQYIDINEMIFRRDCVEKIIRFVEHLKHRYYDTLIDDWLYGLLAMKECKLLYMPNLAVYYTVHLSNIFGGIMDTFEKRMLRLEADLKSLLAFHEYDKWAKGLTETERKILRRSILRRLIFIISAIRREIKLTPHDYIYVGLWILKDIFKHKLFSPTRTRRTTNTFR